MRPDRDWLQFDCALSYGLCEYPRTLEVLKTQGWSASRCIPHAATRCRSISPPVSGSAAMRAIPIFPALSRFPGRHRVENGHIHMPDLPGIGFEGKSDLYKEMNALAA